MATGTSSPNHGTEGGDIHQATETNLPLRRVFPHLEGAAPRSLNSSPAGTTKALRQGARRAVAPVGSIAKRRVNDLERPEPASCF